jgi:hypothetical protein
LKRVVISLVTVALLALLLSQFSAGCGKKAAPRAQTHTVELGGLSGLLSDHRPRPEPGLSKPDYLKAFRDPVFGSAVERVTNAKSWGYSFVVNEYSKADPWNSDGSRMLLLTSKSEWMILDGRTYERLGFVKAENGENLVGAIEPRWHPADPDAFYYFDDNSFMKYSLRKGKGTALHTFKEYVAVSATGEGNLSIDGSKIAIAGHSGPEGTPRDVFVYYINEDRVGPKKDVSKAPAGIDWASVTPNGDYVMILWGEPGGGPCQGGELFDLDWNRVGRVTKGCHHGDFALDTRGRQVFVMSAANDPDFSDAAYIVGYSIPECKAKPLLKVDWYFGLHISGRCWKRPGWVVVSTFHEWNEEGGGPEHGDPEGDWDPFENEIFALALDGSGTVERIAHDHVEKRKYFEEPHAVTNRDLTRIAFSSNWGQDIGKEKADVYVLEP